MFCFAFSITDLTSSYAYAPIDYGLTSASGTYSLADFALLLLLLLDLRHSRNSNSSVLVDGL